MASKMEMTLTADEKRFVDSHPEILHLDSETAAARRLVETGEATLDALKDAAAEELALLAPEQA